MLFIQVLGTGIIPRGFGLAPRKEPFKADLLLIQTILASPSKFTVNMLHPTTKRFVEITNKNVRTMYERYSDLTDNMGKEPPKKDELTEAEKAAIEAMNGTKEETSKTPELPNEKNNNPHDITTDKVGLVDMNDESESEKAEEDILPEEEEEIEPAEDEVKIKSVEESVEEKKEEVPEDEIKIKNVPEETSKTPIPKNATINIPNGKNKNKNKH